MIIDALVNMQIKVNYEYSYDGMKILTKREFLVSRLVFCSCRSGDLFH